MNEVLKELERGSYMHKIKPDGTWNGRRFRISLPDLQFTYKPSFKGCSCSASTWRLQRVTSNVDYRIVYHNAVDIHDMQEVRRGWKTDSFNKVAARMQRGVRVPHPIEEKTCFSVIHGKQGKSLDVVAPSDRIRDQWVTGLQFLIEKIQCEEMEAKHDRWLRKQFEAADENKSGRLNFDEVCQLVQQLNIDMDKKEIKLLFDKANVDKSKAGGKNSLNQDEFLQLYYVLLYRPEVEEIFRKYRGQEFISIDGLGLFLKEEQGMENVTFEECAACIAAYETREDLKEAGYMSAKSFAKFLQSEMFNVFGKSQKILCDDMTQPLSHYYIASSHNTYLMADQLTGDSSVEGYIRALQAGCRCVELDCHDGPEGEPIIYHAYTLTSRIRFMDVISDAIKGYAFVASPYPLILSLEVHCSEEQQAKLAHHLVTFLGDMLYKDPVDPDATSLPSPEALKRKIIIKAKKLPAESGEEAEELDGMSGDERGSGSPNQISAVNGMSNESSSPDSSRVISNHMSDLVNICQAVKFKSFQHSRVFGKPYFMSSFSEGKATEMILAEESDFINYNQRQLCRIYPHGLRTSSSNYYPHTFWNVGCQIVALNYQTPDKPNTINRGMFRQNGGCGYVLKPHFLRSGAYHQGNETRKTSIGFVYQDAGPAGEWRVEMRLVSGSCLPKPKGKLDGEVVDPYVQVKLYGHSKDKFKFKSKFIHNNGFNPHWDEKFEFVARVPHLAHLLFLVKDYKTSGKDDCLAAYSLPLTCLQSGYRCIRLEDLSGNPLFPACIFIHTIIKTN
ncbi:unnamed protein product [Darwinula stevensoni]|uniref:Phosphoinositide phospholipase C n=1 Tax=Darwinula stevensoni TaxID=69355 RepID=A0A7R9A6Y6_9CRUS|nr:unnamed protein product [Darwinula stevensoni]CAG0889393.1 unnamed protein product [Darwinula stevensoni]